MKPQQNLGPVTGDPALDKSGLNLSSPAYWLRGLGEATRPLNLHQREQLLLGLLTG